MPAVGGIYAKIIVQCQRPGRVRVGDGILVRILLASNCLDEFHEVELWRGSAPEMR